MRSANQAVTEFRIWCEGQGKGEVRARTDCVFGRIGKNLKLESGISSDGIERELLQSLTDGAVHVEGFHNN